VEGIRRGRFVEVPPPLEGEGKPLKTFPRWPASGEKRTRASRMRGAWANHRTTTLGYFYFYFLYEKNAFLVPEIVARTKLLCFKFIYISNLSQNKTSMFLATLHHNQLLLLIFKFFFMLGNVWLIFLVTFFQLLQQFLSRSYGQRNPPSIYKIGCIS